LRRLHLLAIDLGLALVLLATGVVLARSEHTAAILFLVAGVGAAIGGVIDYFTRLLPALATCWGGRPFVGKLGPKPGPSRADTTLYRAGMR